MKREAPDLVGTGDRDEQRLLVARQDQAVGARDVVHETIDLAVAAQAEHAAARILQPRLSLVGEIEVAVRCEDQIVRSLEAFAPHVLEDGSDAAIAGIELQNAAAGVGDENAAVAVNLQAVRPSVIFANHRPFRLRRNAQDAPVRNINEIEIAGAIEGRPFQERMQVVAALAEGPAGSPAFYPQMVGEPGKDLALDPSGRLKEHAGSPVHALDGPGNSWPRTYSVVTSPR